MRLRVLLTLAFVAVASLVGLVGYLFSVASNQVLDEVESLRESSIAEVVGATEMALALQASQVAAQELVAERYRARVEPDHESEWGSAEDIDVDAVRDSLREFERQLELSWQATRRTMELARRQGDLREAGGDWARREPWLRGLESEFAVHERLMDRFVHLARYHPSDHVREFVEEELRPHYRDKMLAQIRAYQAEAMAGLADEARDIEATLAVGSRRNRLVTSLALLSALVLGWVIARSISRPLSELAAAARRVGKGQLDSPPQIKARTEVGALAEAFRQMVGDLQEKTVSRSYLDNIIQSMDGMLIVLDSQGRIRTVNRVAQRCLGYSEGELLGRPLGELLVAEAGGAEAAAGEGRLRTAGGREVPVSWTRSLLQGAGGELEGEVYVAHDITVRKEAEARLRTSLQEKEVLLKEVHHRVKNNLQIISSLIRLQGDEVDDELSARRFRESQNRIRSMALIHEQLYRSDDLTRIDFPDYLERLVRHLVGSYGPAARAVGVRLDIDPEPLTIDSAIPCGMIVNELVSNAIEHAFPGGEGEVVVEFRVRDGSHTLAVRDDGAGLPSGFEPARAGSLGLKLVCALAAQLGGSLVHRTSGGTTFEVTYAAGPVPQEATA